MGVGGRDATNRAVGDGGRDATNCVAGVGGRDATNRTMGMVGATLRIAPWEVVVGLI